MISLQLLAELSTQLIYNRPKSALDSDHSSKWSRTVKETSCGAGVVVEFPPGGVMKRRAFMDAGALNTDTSGNGLWQLITNEPSALS